MTSNRRILTKYSWLIVTVMLLFLFLSAAPAFSYASDNGLPSDYVPNADDNRDLSDNVQNKYGIPWHQFKNILTDETVEVQDVRVNCSGDIDGLGIIVYNSTTQETEAVVSPDSNGVIHLPRMKRGHTYILMSDKNEYQLDGSRNVYLWALAKGDNGVAVDGAYEHKINYVRINEDDPIPQNYLKLLDEIKLKRVPSDYYNPRFFSIHTNLPITYKGRPAPVGIKFILTSAENEPIEATTEKQGDVTIIRTELVEDTDYTVHVEDNRYDIDTFALTVKDKSEHKYIDDYSNVQSLGRYTYDHTCCQGVDGIELKDKSDDINTGSISSLKKYQNTDAPLTSVTGMDFKTLLLLVRYPKVTLPEESGVTDYETVELTLANPHRWEKCKITDHEFTVTQMLPQKGTVRNVYQLKDGALEPLLFTQKSRESIEFKMDSMSLYDVVIEYSERGPDPISEATTPAPAGTAIKKITSAKKKLTVRWKKQSGVSGYQIQYGTKKTFNKAKTITINRANATKKTIKKLRSRKKYYVRIRTYNTVSGKMYYSPWSKRKTVKVK